MQQSLKSAELIAGSIKKQLVKKQLRLIPTLSQKVWFLLYVVKGHFDHDYSRNFISNHEHDWFQ